MRNAGIWLLLLDMCVPHRRASYFSFHHIGIEQSHANNNHRENKKSPYTSGQATSLFITSGLNSFMQATTTGKTTKKSRLTPPSHLPLLSHTIASFPRLTHKSCSPTRRQQLVNLISVRPCVSRYLVTAKSRQSQQPCLPSPTAPPPISGHSWLL